MGKPEDDSEITEAVMERQFAQMEEAIEKNAERFGIDLDFLRAGNSMRAVKLS
jgi:hypothetical protein